MLSVVHLSIAAGCFAVPILMRSIHRAVGRGFPELATWRLLKTVFGIGAALHLALAVGIWYPVARFELLFSALVLLAIAGTVLALFLRRRAIVATIRGLLDLQARYPPRPTSTRS